MDNVHHELNPLKLLFHSSDTSDEFSEKITDFFPAIIYVFDADSKKLKYINRQVTDVLGYTYDDISQLDDDLMNLVFTEDIEQVKKELERFYELKDDESHSYDARLNSKQGSWRYFRTQGTVLRRNTKGGPASILFVAQDITQEVEAGNKFRRIDELFNDTQEVLKFGVWEWDVAENKMTWSTGMYKLLGYDAATEKEVLEINPEFYAKHIVEEDRERILQNREHWLTHHEYDNYHKIRDRNGRAKDVREKAKIIRNDKDEVIRVIGSTMDITEQLQLYRDLAEYKTMKQENEEFLGYGTWEYDAIYKKYFWSDGMYKLFGYDPEWARRKITVNDDLYKKHMSVEDYEKGKVITEDLPKKKEKKMEHYSWEFEITTADGNVKRIETYGKVIHDKSGNWIKTVGTSRDITQLREYQQSLEEKVKDLNRSNKELEEFAYVASHDMNEPLRKIRTFIERLETKYKDELGSEGNLYISRIVASVENMRMLIDTLLEFSRTARSNQPFIKVDLNEILAKVKADLELQIEDTGAEIKTQDLPVIEAIPLQMKQLFDNILINSIKFRRPGVKPVIEINCQKLAKKAKDQLHLNVEKNWFQIDIVDNGIGFEPEYNERIFQIFQRLHGKTEYPGSGIGLAICKKITDHHGGIISGTGDTNKGAMFTLILPELQ